MEQAANIADNTHFQTSDRQRIEVLDNTELFHRLLARERQRSERTGEPFVLVSIHCEALNRSRIARPLGEIGIALAACLRVTDITGWHKDQATIGVICTSLNGSSRMAVVAAIYRKVQRVLRDYLHASELDHVKVSFQFFPQNGDTDPASQHGQATPNSQIRPIDVSPTHFRTNLPRSREASIWTDLSTRLLRRVSH